MYIKVQYTKCYTGNTIHQNCIKLKLTAPIQSIKLRKIKFLMSSNISKNFIVIKDTYKEKNIMPQSVTT